MTTTKVTTDDLVKLLTCKLTKKIFHTPIITLDKQVYEYEGYINYCQTNKLPVNRYTVINPLKSFIESFIHDFPEYKNKQYIPIKPKPNSDDITDYSVVYKKVNTAIKSGNYNIIKKYVSYDLGLMDSRLIERIISNATDDIIFHFIDNCLDINKNMKDSQSWKFINYVCSDGQHNPKILRKLMNHPTCNLNNACDDGWRVIHQIIYHQYDDSIIQEFIDYGIDLFTPNNEGESPIELLARHRNEDLIRYALNSIDRNDNKFLSILDNLMSLLEKNRKLDDNSKENIMCLLTTNGMADKTELYQDDDLKITDDDEYDNDMSASDLKDLQDIETAIAMSKEVTNENITTIPSTIPSTISSTSIPSTIPSTSIPSTSIPSTTIPSTSIPSTMTEPQITSNELVQSIINILDRYNNNNLSIANTNNSTSDSTSSNTINDATISVNTTNISTINNQNAATINPPSDETTASIVTIIQNIAQILSTTL